MEMAALVVSMQGSSVAELMLLVCWLYVGCVLSASTRHEGGTDTNTPLSLTDLQSKPIHPQVLSHSGNRSNFTLFVLIETNQILKSSTS